jgi:anti-sigma regulatory factor (Ser/Thr protein kinase)
MATGRRQHTIAAPRAQTHTCPSTTLATSAHRPRNHQRRDDALFSSLLGELRDWLRTRLEDVDMTAERAETVVLAVNEVAGNGLRHGRPPVRVTLWATAAHILCDVTDRGPGITDPLAGYTPPDPRNLAEHGAGLWVTRRLCDEVKTARSRTDFTVRLAVSRAEPGNLRCQGRLQPLTADAA